MICLLGLIGRQQNCLLWGEPPVWISCEWMKGLALLTFHNPRIDSLKPKDFKILLVPNASGLDSGETPDASHERPVTCPISQNMRVSEPQPWAEWIGHLQPECPIIAGQDTFSLIRTGSLAWEVMCLGSATLQDSGMGLGWWSLLISFPKGRKLSFPT